MLGDHVTAVRLRHLTNDRQPEPGPRHPARPTGAVETVEDVREVLVRDARAVVSHREPPVADLHLDLGAGRAPLRRVVEQVPHGPLDRRRHSLHDRWLELDAVRHLGSVAASSLHCVGDEQVETDVFRIDGHLLGACELDELRDERRHLAELLDHVREQARSICRGQHAITREYLDVRAHAREGRSELMRSVGDELPLGASGLLQRGEHPVEACREPAQLIVPGHLDALGEVLGLAHSLHRLRQLAHRRERCARDDKPEARRNDHAAGCDEKQEEADATERLVDLVQRASDLNRGTGSIRKREHANVRAVDCHVFPERSALVSCHRERALSDGKLELLPGRHEDRSIPAYELHVSTCLTELRLHGEVVRPTLARDHGKLLECDLSCSSLEGLVDRRTDLLARDEVEENRCGDDGKCDRRGCRDCDPCPERHDSRSA